MAKKINFSVHDILEVATENSDEFAIARLGVLSTDKNSHKINITEEILRRDAPSILGKWVVADYIDGRKDVGTHSRSEVIVGNIPPNQEPVFITDEDGITTMYVDAVISKIYATEVYNLFRSKNFRNASVEMATAGDVLLPDGSTDIDGLKIFGITILGSDAFGNTINGSCPQANITITQFSEEEANKYYSHNRTVSLSEIGEALSKVANQLKELGDIKSFENDKENEMAKVALEKKEEEKDVIMSESEEKEQEEKEFSDESEVENSEEDKDFSDEEKVDSEEENKNEQKDMSETVKRNDDDVDDDKDKDEDEEIEEDEKDLSCGTEKEFAFVEFLSEENSALVEEKEELKNFCSLDADGMITKFAELYNQCEELKAFRSQIEEDEKRDKINKVLASVKIDLEEEQYAKLFEESKTIAFEDVEGFCNKVKAFAYENAKQKTSNEENGMLFFGGHKETKLIEDDDVFVRLQNK